MEWFKKMVLQREQDCSLCQYGHNLVPFCCMYYPAIPALFSTFAITFSALFDIFYLIFLCTVTNFCNPRTIVLHY